MVKVAQFPLAARGLRLLITEDATLRLSVETDNISEPEGDEVVVRVEGAPVNPGDLWVMLGDVPPQSFQRSGEGETAVLSAPIPPASFAQLKAQAGQSRPAGIEGMGTVVAAGPQAKDLLGKKVSVFTFGGGTYAQFCKTARASCFVLPDDTEPEFGAGAFSNPLTALAMVETVREEGHTGFVHTAAASNLGQMLVKICQADGIGLVNVVRSEEQVKLLKGLGAQFVCNSTSPDFLDELTEAIRGAGATVAFDAVGGGDLPDQLLVALGRANGPMKPKKVYVYGMLDERPIVLRKEFGMGWGMEMWGMMSVLAKISPAAADALKARIARELKTTFASSFGHSIALDELLEPANLIAACAHRTGGKFLIKPNSGSDG